MQNFHLPLPDPIHASLRAAAQAQGRPATDLARELVQDGLERLQRIQRQAEVRAFAEAMAGTDMDLDADLEAAGIEALTDQGGAL